MHRVRFARVSLARPVGVGQTGRLMEERVNHLLPNVARWPNDPAQPVIALKDVVKGFDGVRILDKLSLNIETGLTTVIAGESGTGKSVLLKMMNGLMVPDEGQVLLFGEDTREVKPDRLLWLRKRVTMMFQNYALMDSMPVRENIAFPLYENTRMRWRDIIPLVDELLNVLDLPDAGDKLPSELSGGMKKRVSFARAVITNPEVVLFDEPTTGLDPVMIEFVDKMIIHAREQFGITSVIISHDMTSTLNLADRLAILENGKITAYGTVDHVLKSGRDLVRVFFEDVGRLEGSSEPVVAESPASADTQPEIRLSSTTSVAPAFDLEASDAGPSPLFDCGDDDVIAALDGVHRWFGRHHVLKGVDLRIPKGRISVLIGGSGSGKSVTMKHIIGLLQPDQGKVQAFGQDLSKLNGAQLLALRERYGMVFQGAALLDALTIRDNISFPLRERGVGRVEVRERTDETLEKLRLTSMAHRMPSDVSNGQRKRVGLARAIITRPEMVIYDEPTTGQDPVLTRYLDDMIVEAEELFGITSLVVSHDMPSAFRIGHQVAMLYRGRILAAESPEGLTECRDPRVRRFIFAGTDEGEAAAAEMERLGLSSY